MQRCHLKILIQERSEFSEMQDAVRVHTEYLLTDIDGSAMSSKEKIVCVIEQLDIISNDTHLMYVLKVTNRLHEDGVICCSTFINMVHGTRTDLVDKYYDFIHGPNKTYRANLCKIVMSAWVFVNMQIAAKNIPACDNDIQCELKNHEDIL